MGGAMTNISSEDQLQELIEKEHDKYLPGDLINPLSPRKWLLVSREIWTGSGNLDILFLDQDAIPTFVECKLCKNPESKGGIVWQLIDYLANARYTWTSDYLFKNAISAHNYSQEKLIYNFNHVGTCVDIKHFFDIAEYNIRNAKVRLIFYLDKTPNNLLVTFHELREYISNQNIELFLIDLNYNNIPTIKELTLSDIPSHLLISDSHQKRIDFHLNLEKIGKEELFDEFNKLILRNGFANKYSLEGWCSYLKNNTVQFYIGVKDDSLILERAEKVTVIDSYNIEQLQELIEMINKAA